MNPPADNQATAAMEARAKRYGEMFDIYMERGTMPPPPQQHVDTSGFAEGENDEFAAPIADPLAEYIRTVVDDPGNHNIMSGDEVWRDIIRTSLTDFISKLLPHYDEIDREAVDELGLIGRLMSTDAAGVRQLWPAIKATLEGKYSPAEVNSEGYGRMLDSNPSDFPAIIDALKRDWLKALRRRNERLKRQLVNDNREQFERYVREAGAQDHESVSRTADIVYNYPALREILRVMGREHEKNPELTDHTITRYVPQLVSRAPSMSDIDGVTIGSDLRRLLPGELVRLDDPLTEAAFYADFAAGRLSIYSSKPPVVQQEKTDTERRPKPRLERGPMIVAIDTSWSMRGRPETISKAITMQILMAAKRQNRKCLLITYSVRSRTLELTSRSGYSMVRKFMAERFTGGTSGESMFSDVVKALSSEDFGMADVLIISDFEFPNPQRATLKKVMEEKARSTRFYGLAFRGGPYDYAKILDRTWRI